MYYINKIVFALLNPVAFSLVLAIFAIFCAIIFDIEKGKFGRKIVFFFAFLSMGWLFFFSLPASIRITGLPLEKEYKIANASQSPTADAIVVLGGGVYAKTNSMEYAELQMGGDRVLHAARLYKAGKAPLVIVSGCTEERAGRLILLELGVPEEAIIAENTSRNTEENAKLTEEMLKEKLGGKAHPKILLVTSAWHMRRSEYMFEKYAPDLEVIPAPCDWEATCAIDRDLEFKDFLPSPDALAQNSAYLKELVGFWGYKILRR